ncbi:MAG: hypothetical protein K6A73_03970 [Bacteroidales bacterium]|nr:hypothetical protein [Bacteroidales bacterium]
MKKLVFLIFSIIFGINFVYSQSSNEPIVIEDDILGHHYYHGDNEIKTISKMKAIVANDELALQEIKKAAVPQGVSYVFAFAGGFAIGWEIVDILYGKFNPYILAGGVGMTAVGYGFSALADKHILKGVQIYNSNLETPSQSDDVKLEVGFVPGGVGFTLYF